MKRSRSAMRFIRVLAANASASWPQPCSITSSGSDSERAAPPGMYSRKRRAPAAPTATPVSHAPRPCPVAALVGRVCCSAFVAGRSDCFNARVPARIDRRVIVPSVRCSDWAQERREILFAIGAPGLGHKRRRHAGVAMRGMLICREGEMNTGTLLRGLVVASAALWLPALAQQAQTSKWVNLRAGPARDYPLVMQLPPATPVGVQGCISDFSWCDVITPDNVRGWIYAANLLYPYQSSAVPLLSYGPVIGVPIITFSIGPYWGRYYRDRPWYGEEPRWARRPPPHRVRPPGPPPIYAPPPRSGIRPPGPPHGERPPGVRPPGERPSPGVRPPGERPTPGVRPPGERPPGVRPPEQRPTPGGPGARPPEGPGARPPGARPPQPAPGARPPEQRPAPGARPPEQRPGGAESGGGRARAGGQGGLERRGGDRPEQR